MPAWLLAIVLATAATSVAPPAGATPARAASDRNEIASGPDELLTLPDALRQRFHEEVLSHAPTPARRLDAMMRFLYDEDGLGMRYAVDATHDVGEAYRTRQANCLSFTLLTIALAREAGFDAYGQHHERILAWRQQDSNLVLSNHVNAGIRIRHRQYTVDVASDSVVVQDAPARMTDTELAALYHSNRAMERLLEGTTVDALAHAQRSLQLDTRSATLWNNAGVAHLRSGDLQAATRAYERAIALDPRHAGALFNLAQAYQRDGDAAGAQRLQERAKRVLERDPFHHFLQGYAAEGRGELVPAEAHYRRAIRLLGNEHRFYFALARVQSALGQHDAALRSLRRARELGDDEDRLRYQSKLELLQARLR